MVPRSSSSNFLFTKYEFFFRLKHFIFSAVTILCDSVFYYFFFFFFVSCIKTLLSHYFLCFIFFGRILALIHARRLKKEKYFSIRVIGWGFKHPRNTSDNVEMNLKAFLIFIITTSHLPVTNLQVLLGKL